MAMMARLSGVWEEITSRAFWDGSAWLSVKRREVYDGTDWRVVASFVPDLTLSKSPEIVSATGFGDGFIITNPVQVTPSGGKPPFTYSWVGINGAQASATASASAQTQFRRYVSTGDSITEQFRCTVTDNDGVAVPIDVSAQFTSADLQEDDLR